MFLTASAINCYKTHSFTLPQAESMGSFVGKATLDIIGACAGIWIISIGHLSFYGYVSALGAAISLGFLADGGYGFVRQCIRLCSSKKILQGSEDEKDANMDVVYFGRREEKKGIVYLCQRGEDDGINEVMPVVYFGRNAPEDEVTRSYISEVMHSDCPFLGGFKVEETSTMINIPTKIDASNYNLSALLQWLNQKFQVPYDQASYDRWVKSMDNDIYNDPAYFILILENVWFQGSEKERESALRQEKGYNENLDICAADYPSLREAVFRYAAQYFLLKQRVTLPMLWCSETVEPQGQEGKRLRLAVGFKEECGIYFGAFPMDETNDEIEFHPVRKAIRNL